MSFPEKYPMRGQFVYRDILFFCGDPVCMTSPERIRKIRDNFEVRDDDIAIASYPRTGSHWAAEIACWIQFLHAGENLLKEDHFIRVPLIEIRHQGDEKTFDAFDKLPWETPRIYKTHLPSDMAPIQLETKGKIIYTIRNPKDTAVSFYHLYRIGVQLGPYEGTWSEFMEAFTNGKVLIGDYFDHVLKWWARREDENVLIVRYEEMKKDPRGSIRNISAFLGKTLTDEEVEKIVLKTSFEAMKGNPLTNLSLMRDKCSNLLIEREDAQFVRKGTVGNWKAYFTVAQNEHFDKLIEEKLADSGLVFEYE